MSENYGTGEIKKTKKKTLKRLFISVLSLILVLTITVTAFVIDKFNKMGEKIDENPQETVASEDNQKDDIIFAEEPGNIDIDIGSSDFKEAIKKWATTDNDKKMSDKSVINVLLVGFDSREGSYSGNTDVMMVASLNKKTKQIKLVSFLRDTYCYIETEKGSYYTKLNAAYSLGGIECLEKTIENNYKIEIDNYVLVNFESFKAIIDAMGGVTVKVEQYEAAYLNDVMGLNVRWGESVRQQGDGRGQRASGDVRWGELCRQLWTEGRRTEGLGAESTWRPTSKRSSMGTRVGAPGSGGHQTQVMSLLCRLCLRSGWG